MKEKLESHNLITETKNEKGIVIRRRIQTFNHEPSRTQQQFKDDADVNVIIKKYGTTGINPFVRQDGYYADLTEVPDLQTALSAVKKAEEAFQSLPSQVRERFGNNPDLMINFLRDEKNTEEGIKLGLIKKPEPPKEPVQVHVVASDAPKS